MVFFPSEFRLVFTSYGLVVRDGDRNGMVFDVFFSLEIFVLIHFRPPAVLFIKVIGSRDYQGELYPIIPALLF